MSELAKTSIELTVWGVAACFFVLGLLAGVWLAEILRGPPHD